MKYINKNDELLKNLEIYEIDIPKWISRVISVFRVDYRSMDYSWISSEGHRRTVKITNTVDKLLQYEFNFYHDYLSKTNKEYLPQYFYYPVVTKFTLNEEQYDMLYGLSTPSRYLRTFETLTTSEKEKLIKLRQTDIQKFIKNPSSKFW